MYLCGMFAIIDTETTGGQVGEEKIIDLAIFLFDGEKVVDQIITLINPKKPIQPFVQKMTGITNTMVTRAPRFHEIAKRVVEITENAVLIGHNIAFDYRMLRQEFKELGYSYERETLDTLFLAEGLIPGLPAYGLSSISKELNIINTAKHRAEGDARLTLELFEILIQKDEQKKLFGIRSMYTNKPKEQLGKTLRNLLRNVTTRHGVYYVFDQEGECIYLCPLHQAKENITRRFLSDTAENLRFQVMASESATEHFPSKWQALWKSYSDFQNLRPVFVNQHPLFKQKIGIYINEGRYRSSKSPDNEEVLLWVSSPFIAGKTVQYLNEKLDGQKACKEHLRWALIGEKEVVETFHGRDVAEKLYLIWKDYHLKGYIYSNTEEELKKKDAMALRAIPLMDDAYGLGIWLENTTHLNLLPKRK
jgi:DNA polymerase III subunit epsilon